MLRRTCPATPSPISRHWSDDDPVVQGRPVVNGTSIPMFGDDVWDLQCLMFRSNAEGTDRRCDFRQLDDPSRRLTAKELVMQRLNRPLPAARRSKRPVPISAPTASDIVGHLRRIWKFMDERNIARLLDLRQIDLDAFYRALVADRTKPKHHVYVLKTFYWLYESRDWLTHDHLGFLPWDGRSLLSITGYEHSKENTTPRIPETVMGPLLRWALAYVDWFSGDIVAALRSEGMWESATRPGREAAPRGAVETRLASWLAGLRERREPLPGRPDRKAPSVSLAAVAHHIDVFPPSLRPHRATLEAAAEELGIVPFTSDVNVSVPPGVDQPWRAPFDSLAMRAECRHLVEACYIVTAYLSGMRDSEMQDLRRGCHEPLLDEQGAILRHRLRSVTYKGRDNAGEERTWVVIEPVARAIEVLERLTERFAEETGCSLLMVNVHNRVTGFAVKSSINRRLREFRDHINAVVAPRMMSLNVGPIPNGPDGKPWPISTRQFRRTTAWHIANRPFGTVAGMIQYGHTAEMVFEGYAGSSESGFRSEVEAERALARRVDIVEMYEDFKRGVRPAGPMAGNLEGEFQHVREDLDDFPGKVVDERRRDKMLKHLRIRLFPGLLADCFFTAEEARCLRHLRVSDRREPVAGLCDPHCTNACWTRKHLAVWEHTLEDTTQLGRRNRVSPIQRDILRGKADECRGVIGAIKQAARGH